MRQHGGQWSVFPTVQALLWHAWANSGRVGLSSQGSYSELVLWILWAGPRGQTFVKTAQVHSECKGGHVPASLTLFFEASPPTHFFPYVV